MFMAPEKAEALVKELNADPGEHWTYQVEYCEPKDGETIRYARVIVLDETGHQLGYL